MSEESTHLVNICSKKNIVVQIDAQCTCGKDGGPKINARECINFRISDDCRAGIDMIRMEVDSNRQVIQSSTDMRFPKQC